MVRCIAIASQNHSVISVNEVVYAITGPVYVPSLAQSPGIGPGQVRVPKYLFKLVYDQSRTVHGLTGIPHTVPVGGT